MSNDLKIKFEQMYLKPNPWKCDNTIKDFSRSEIILDLLKYGRFSKCLDIGCGEGVFTNRIIPYVDSIDAFDISEAAIGRAIKNFNNDRINFYVQDARELGSFKSYDLIFCLEMLYYLNEHEREKILLDICNSLKSGGVCILSVVVSGKNQYGDYFTLESILSLLDGFFRIVYVFPIIPKSRLISSLLKLLSITNTRKLNWYKLFSLSLSPAKAYQSGFVLIKK